VQENPDRRDNEPCPGPLATFEFNLPTIFLLVVDRRLHPRIQLDVGTQIKFLRHIIEIPFILRLAGEVFFPVPFLQQFL
jgi:hypothetical protein